MAFFKVSHFDSPGLCLPCSMFYISGLKLYFKQAIISETNLLANLPVTNLLVVCIVL